MLCVANLSRFAQPFELDLTALAGMTPVEMLGYVEFPKIGRAPYPLTLGPYGFLWFELHGEPEPAVAAPEPGTAELSLRVELGVGWEPLAQAGTRAVLEATILPEYLPRQRWFGAKSRTIQSCSIDDWLPLTRSACLAFCTVQYQAGAAETYLVPLALAEGTAAERIREATPNAVLCPVATAGRSGVLYDALADDDNCRALLELAGGGAERRGTAGTLDGRPGEEFGKAPAPEGGWSVIRLGAEQSNTSIVFGDRLILKVFRRTAYGPQPDCEITRYLTEQRHFPGVPAYVGAVEYTPAPQAVPATVAMVQRLVPSQGDGWHWMQEELGRYQERALTLGAPDEAVTNDLRAWLEVGDAGLTEYLDELLGVSDDAAAALGRRTGELHLALAAPTGDPAFGPEPLTAADMTQLAGDVRRSAAGAFEHLKEFFSRLPDDVVDQASRALSLRGRIAARVDRLDGLDPECAKIRIHGDYHLGQVLRTGPDFVVIDFEGEPARPLAERRARSSPLRDVAGMLRSFGYASEVALMSHTARRPGDLDRLLPWMQLWERSVCGMFLGAWLRTVDGAGLAPADRGGLTALLEAYLLDKVLYELRYELDNRPTWLRAPLAGLLALSPGQLA